MGSTGHSTASGRESTAQQGRAGESLLDRIGNTPLLLLERVGQEYPNVEFYAKAERFNPGGAVKERPPLSMILAGFLGCGLRPGQNNINASIGKNGYSF